MTEKKKKRKLNPLRLVLLIFLAGLLVVFALAGGYTIGAIIAMPKWDPEQLQVSESTIIYDTNTQEFNKLHQKENRIYVSIDQMPQALIDAFVATEDNRFYEHHGVDLRAIARAVIANIRGGIGTEGGSTVTQQLIKHAFLSPEKSFKRKIQEAILALKLERQYTKDEILELYLNRIYFSRGAYGVQAAALTFFGKDVKELDIAESAMLAGIVRRPNAYSPLINPDLAKKRQQTVLDLMVKYGKITPLEAADAKAKELEYLDKSESTRYKYPYFTDHVINELERIFAEKGYSDSETANMIYKGGLRVYTTLDPKVQSRMEEVYENDAFFPKSKQGQIVQSAMALLDPHTGEVKGIIGGRGHEGQRLFNRATQATRQPGSSIKPITVYAPALENGYYPAFVLNDAPVTYNIAGENWSPKNYDGKYRGLIPMRTAIQHSVNVYAVKMLDQIGVSEGFKYAEELGITSLVKSGSKNDYGLAPLALGGLTHGASPLEMAAAYGTFANQGIYTEPFVINKILDKHGQLIFENRTHQKVAVSEQTAYLLTDMLQTVVKSGTGTKAQLGSRPVAGKTGTTQFDKDAWFIGYTPELVASVWMGFDEDLTMSNVYGGGYGAPIWKAVMSEVLKDVPIKPFSRPSGIVSRTVCVYSGLLPGDYCPDDALRSEIFAQGTVPKETCNTHVIAEICAESGLLATEYCPHTISGPFLIPPGSEAKKCNLHGPDAKVTVKICTDPRHGGKPYLANEGCPSQFVVEQEFLVTEKPKEYCSLPGHRNNGNNNHEHHEDDDDDIDEENGG